MNFWHDPRLMNWTAALVTLAALVGLLYASIAAGLRSPRFDFRAIEVRSLSPQGLRHVNSATVRANALPGLRGGFFTMNLEATRRAFETVPWVRRANVARHWPDLLVVTLEEHAPLATWGDGRGINTHGEWFAANPAELEQYGDLPTLLGPAGTEQRVAQRLRDFTDWFAPLDLQPKVVELTARYAWRVTMKNQVVIELGREPDDNVLKYRVDRFIAHYDAVRARWGGAPTHADLRYPNGFAVKVAGVKFLSASVTEAVKTQ